MCHSKQHNHFANVIDVLAQHSALKEALGDHSDGSSVNLANLVLGVMAVRSNKHLLHGCFKVQLLHVKSTVVDRLE